METLIQDIRFGIRGFLKNPGVTLVAVLTLALGIGANAAIFSGVSAFLFRPLPVPEADRLARPFESTEDRGNTDELSYPDFVEYRDQNSVFTGMAAEDMIQVAFGTQEANDVIWGQVVSGDYFDVLKVQPVMGRSFLPEEDKVPGAAPVVIISYKLWENRLGSDPAAVGKIVAFNGRPYTVIGVAPDYFKGTKFALVMDFWVPMMMAEELRRDPGLLASRGSHWMNTIVRLKPGVSFAQATAEMSAIAERLNQAYPNERANSTRAMVATEIDGRWEEAAVVVKSGSAIAMAIVGLVLLIACANIANLLLARAAARRREIGIRLALGASRARLVRQLLTESLMLAVLGGGVGLLFAYWVTHLMQAFIPVLPYNVVNDFFALDSRALLFTFTVSLATGLIFGLAPAWQASSPDFVPVLKGNLTAATTGKRRRVTLGNTLVIAQVALSIVVLVCAALFVRSFRNAQQMDPGFGASNMLMVSLNPQLINYDEVQTKAFFERIMDASANLPGVEAVSVARLAPLGDSSNSNGPILKEGEQLPPGAAGRDIMTNVVSPGYFKTLQIPITEGRDFDGRERKGTQRTIIVNQRMAEVLWPNETAIGKRIFIGTDSRDGLEVVGVVKTGKYRSLAEDPRPYFYYPMDQRGPAGMILMIRTSGDPRKLVEPVRNQVQAIDRRMPVFAVKTMTEHLTFALWAPEMAATLSIAFGLVALLLSAVGLYSVMAYVVSQRTRELGIRMALGAKRGDVLRMVAGDGMSLAAIGIAIGLILAFLLVRVLSSVLIGIGAYDAVTFLIVPLLLAMVAMVASLLPARRATKVDPLVALRYE